MPDKPLRRKYGVVVVLDALGASTFTESQIRQFLSTRSSMNASARDFPALIERGGVKEIGTFPHPAVFTFGDTVIITVPLRSKKHIRSHIFFVALLMRRYIFYSFERGIMFRGAFSVGHYIEDGQSNTVMGPALSDAVAWYDQSEWMGISSTPKTNSVLEYIQTGSAPGKALFSYMEQYDVPMKGGKTFRLYTINWPSAFLEKSLIPKGHQTDPSKYFLERLQDFEVPKGTEMKYENTKKYFAEMIARKANKPEVGAGK